MLPLSYAVDGAHRSIIPSTPAAALPNLLPPLSCYRGEILSPGIIMGPAIFSSPFFTTKGRTRRGAQPEWGW